MGDCRRRRREVDTPNEIDKHPDTRPIALMILFIMVTTRVLQRIPYAKRQRRHCRQGQPRGLSYRTHDHRIFGVDGHFFFEEVVGLVDGAEQPQDVTNVDLDGSGEPVTYTQFEAIAS